MDQSGEQLDRTDSPREGVPDFKLRHGSEGATSWIEITDSDGRQMGLVEGRLDGSNLEVTRAHVTSGSGEARAAELLRAHIDSTGHELASSSLAETRVPSGARSIVGDLRTPDELPEIRDLVHSDVVDLRPRDITAPLRSDISSMYPADYVEAAPEHWENLRELRAQTADPKGWIEAVNPGHSSDLSRLEGGEPIERLNRVHNCCDCARSLQDTLDDHPSVASAGTFESMDRLEQWAGRPDQAIDSYDSVLSELVEPGDSAVLVATFDDGTGHAFNAINIDGVVSYVDAQTGKVEPWPPAFAEDTVDLRGWYFENGGRRD
jgi:hypothetical protein